jgi:hypothetical protein
MDIKICLFTQIAVKNTVTEQGEFLHIYFSTDMNCTMHNPQQLVSSDATKFSSSSKIWFCCCGTVKEHVNAELNSTKILSIFVLYSVCIASIPKDIIHDERSSLVGKIKWCV